MGVDLLDLGQGRVRGREPEAVRYLCDPGLDSGNDIRIGTVRGPRCRAESCESIVAEGVYRERQARSARDLDGASCGALVTGIDPPHPEGIRVIELRRIGSGQDRRVRLVLRGIGHAAHGHGELPRRFVIAVAAGGLQILHRLVDLLLAVIELAVVIAGRVP